MVEWEPHVGTVGQLVPREAAWWLWGWTAIEGGAECYSGGRQDQPQTGDRLQGEEGAGPPNSVYGAPQGKGSWAQACTSSASPPVSQVLPSSGSLFSHIATLFSGCPHTPRPEPSSWMDHHFLHTVTWE